MNKKKIFAFLFGLTLLVFAIHWGVVYLSSYWAHEDHAAVNSTKKNMNLLRIEIERFKNNCGYYPISIDQIMVASADCPGFEASNPNMTLKDGWGKTFEYVKRENAYILRSSVKVPIEADEQNAAHVVIPEK